MTKCSLASRRRDRDAGHHFYIKTVVEPILEEVALNFWANERSLRVDSEEVVEQLMKYCETERNVKLDFETRAALGAHVQLPEGVADRKMTEEERRAEEGKVLEAEIGNLRAEIEYLGWKLETVNCVEHGLPPPADPAVTGDPFNRRAKRIPTGRSEHSKEGQAGGDKSPGRGSTTN